MNRKTIGITAIIGAFAFVGGMMVAVSGCRSSETKDANKAATSQVAEKHEAHHGGCLNAIETCAVGHAEVKVEGDVLRLWFVGGENETDKAVRVSDKQIALAVKPDGGEEKALVLDAKPNSLAEEKVGDCSYFEGKADWLAGIRKFQATGKVNLKGAERPIRIEFPDGYDPD